MLKLQYEFHVEKWDAKGHFRQGYKEQGPMKLSITISLETLLLTFRQGSKTKTNQIVI